MPILFPLVAAAAVASASPRPVLADGPTPMSSLAEATDSLPGRVADSPGTPVPSAQVTFVELARGATTDARGGFVFADVPPGRYTIVARRLGYAPSSRTVRAGGGGRTPLDI